MIPLRPNAIHYGPSRSRAAKAFTITELVMASAIFLVVGLIAYAMLAQGLVQMARNLSINQSSMESRSSWNYVTRKLEDAVDSPDLVRLVSGSWTNATTTNLVITNGFNTTSTQTNTYNTGTNSVGLRFHRRVGGAYKVTGPVSTNVSAGGVQLSYTATNTTNFTLLYQTSVSGTPQVGDRLMLVKPYVEANESSGPSQGLKPGLRITAVGNVTNVSTNSITAQSVSVTVASAPGKAILCDNTAYVVREVAFATLETSGRRELRYYNSTTNFSPVSAANPRGYAVVARDLDTLPQEFVGTTPIQPFGMVDGGLTPQILLFLPVRSAEYSNVLTRAGSTNNFNVYLRTRTQIPLRNFILTSTNGS